MVAPAFNLDLSFQSTLPRRERPKLSIDGYMDYLISIHAPAKGATAGKTMIIDGIRDFNPRSREGSDLPCQLRIICKMEFQSTLPRRERPDTLEAVFRPVYISIHAPAKGATS